MKYIKCRWLLAMIMSCSLFSCTNLDEEVFDRVDAGIYYQDETSVQGAVAAIYSKAAYSIWNTSGICRSFLPTRWHGAVGTVDFGDGMRH